MKYNIITTQTEIYNSFLQTGLIARAIKKKIIKIKINSLYDFATDIHKTIDDTPYGGGAGMVLKVDIIDKALKNVKCQMSNVKARTILLTPQGKKLDQKTVKRLSKYDELIIISGRFEGYDERIRDLVDEEISIGDYVLTSGDLPAMVLMDSVSRQIPGFIDRKESIENESFVTTKTSNLKPITLLEYPQYTRPEVFDGKKVPKVLLSGNHAEIAKWRRKEAEKKTKKRRPDLTI